MSKYDREEYLKLPINDLVDEIECLSSQNWDMNKDGIEKDRLLAHIKGQFSSLKAKLNHRSKRIKRLEKLLEYCVNEDYECNNCCTHIDQVSACIK
jgi:hypothetical protein